MVHIKLRVASKPGKANTKDSDDTPDGFDSMKDQKWPCSKTTLVKFKNLQNLQTKARPTEKKLSLSLTIQKKRKHLIKPYLFDPRMPQLGAPRRSLEAPVPWRHWNKLLPAETFPTRRRPKPSSYRCFLVVFRYSKASRKHLLQGLGIKKFF